jgi:hypothetical protein
LYRTSDAGATWTRFELPVGNDDIRAVRLFPGCPDTIAAAGINGVVISLDAGETWTQLNDGLGCLRVSWLEFADNGACLIAATYGRSCFLWTFPTAVADEPGPGRPSLLSRSVARGTALIRLPAHDTPVHVRLLDVTGRAVRVERAPARASELEIDLQDLPSGIYFVEVSPVSRGSPTRLVLL